MIIDELWQFPVKGLGGVRLSSADLVAGRPFPGDRQFAITTGHPRFADTPDGNWQKKAAFLQLMSHERLVAVDYHFEGTVITISRDGTEQLTADMDTVEGAAGISAFFADLLGDSLAGSPRLMRINDGAYTDQKAPWISLGGTASVAHVARTMGHRPDARRYRLNVMLETQTPFEEANLIGHKITLGDAVLSIVEPVGRCAAIDVDPENGERGPHLLPRMETSFGHTDLGIFAEIIDGGTVTPGDRLRILDQAG
jgi:uncharacterized protein YcbX